MDTSQWRIVQVIPGDGWIAVMRGTEGSSRGTSDKPLIGWALVSDLDKVHRTVGLMLGLDGRQVVFAESDSMFPQYTPRRG